MNLNPCRICEGVGELETVGADQPNPWIECSSCGETSRRDLWQQETPVNSPMRRERDSLREELRLARQEVANLKSVISRAADKAREEADYRVARFLENTLAEKGGGDEPAK